MPSHNGKLVGILSIVVLIIITFIGYMVANDLMSRNRDTAIASDCKEDMVVHKETIQSKLDGIVKVQSTQSTQLGSIETALEFIKDRVR